MSARARSSPYDHTRELLWLGTPPGDNGGKPWLLAMGPHPCRAPTHGSLSGPSPGNLKLAGRQSCRQPHLTLTRPARVLSESASSAWSDDASGTLSPLPLPRHHPAAPPLPELGRKWRDLGLWATSHVELGSPAHKRFSRARRHCTWEGVPLPGQGWLAAEPCFDRTESSHWKWG